MTAKLPNLGASGSSRNNVKQSTHCLHTIFLETLHGYNTYHAPASASMRLSTVDSVCG